MKVKVWLREASGNKLTATGEIVPMPIDVFDDWQDDAKCIAVQHSDGRTCVIPKDNIAAIDILVANE